MFQNTIIGYISLLGNLYKKDPKFDSATLNILGHFAWERCLSAYQICSKLKSTQFKMAYKNVNKRVNALVMSGLIQETEIIDGNNKHNAKYYKLTEYGIYQLFLKGLDSLYVNQSDVRKGKELPSSNALTFFRNYSDSMLFEIFLYPYFKKDSILAIGDDLLVDLYRYLASCCDGIEKYLKYGQGIDIPVVDKIFSWNKIPGEDDEKLMQHLKQIFNLESIKPYDIKKKDIDGEYPKRIVKTSSAPPIIITLDKVKKKVVVMSSAGNSEYTELEYDVFHLGQEMVVGKRIPPEGSIKDILNDAKKQIEQLIYGFVYELASVAAKDPEKQKRFHTT